MVGAVFDTGEEKAARAHDAEIWDKGNRKRGSDRSVCGECCGRRVGLCDGRKKGRK